MVSDMQNVTKESLTVGHPVALQCLSGLPSGHSAFCRRHVSSPLRALSVAFSAWLGSRGVVSLRMPTISTSLALRAPDVVRADALLALGLAACGSTDDASTEAMPDTVEMPADEALEPVTEAPVEDSDALGPPADPAENAPTLQTAEEAADAAENVAAEAEAAAAAAAAIEE